MTDILDKLRAHGLNELDVYVDRKFVAVLKREGRKFVLTYVQDCDPKNFISLSMPVRAESWVSQGKLHPFFEMNLPEGYRRDLIERTFGKALMNENMSLLAIVGGDSIGRVKIVPRGFDQDWKDPFVASVSDLNINTDMDMFFTDAMERYSAQGVSGVHPKVLMTDSRLTIPTRKWIVKRDGADMPSLSRNEYLTMLAASRAGLDTPEVLLSADEMSLFVRRFDVDEKGDPIGFEDLCSLMGLYANEKYSGTAERLMKVVSLVLSREHRPSAKHDIIKSLIFNICVGNSDGHLKNYGVLYDKNGVRSSPMFDIVSTRAYDRLRNDIPAISINNTKEWVVNKALRQLAVDVGVSKSGVEAIIDQIEEAISDTIQDVDDIISRSSEFTEIGNSMIKTWTNGLNRIKGIKVAVEDEVDIDRNGYAQ